MKKYIIILGIALTGLVSSCTIDRLPGNAISTDEAFKTFADAEAFRTGMYSQYRNSNYTIRKVLSDHQVDIVNGVSDYGNRRGLLYGWQDGLATDYDIRDFYQINYTTLSNVNSFISGVEFIEVKDAAQEALLNQYKGEAHLMRASLFHNLVQYFAKAYNPASADSDLGISLPLEYNPNAKLPRASLAETYKQIQSDLDKAKALLPDGTQPMSMYLTKDFAHAIQARVSLETHDFKGAIAAADKIIPKYELADTELKLKALWNDDHSSEILVKLYTSTTEGRAAGPSYISYSSTTGIYSPDYVPSKKVLDLYSAGDFRKEVYFTTQDIQVAGSNFENVILINKYPGNPVYNTNPAQSSYVNNPKLFMISEAHLIKAEAEARGSIGNAIATLNNLRVKRGASALTGGDALKMVKEERLREMLAEGQRILDLKRWGEGLDRTGGQPAIQGGLFVTNDAPTLKKPANDKMFVWEIPINDLRTNVNMKPNW